MGSNPNHLAGRNIRKPNILCTRGRAALPSRRGHRPRGRNNHTTRSPPPARCRSTQSDVACWRGFAPGVSRRNRRFVGAPVIQCRHRRRLDFNRRINHIPLGVRSFHFDAVVRDSVEHFGHGDSGGHNR